MKKLFSIMLGTACAATLVVACPKTADAAGMPCTEATIAQAQALKAQADQELANVVAAKAQADANVAALKAAGVTGLELLQATDAATNAANVVAAYQGKVANAQAYIDNIVSRGNTEQYYLDMETKWKNRASLDSVQTQLTGANSLTAGALQKVQVLQGELAKAVANAAANPALAGNVDVIKAQLAAAEAEYASAKANSDALAAQYSQKASVNNYATDADNAAYAKFVQDYAKSLGKEAILEYDCEGKPTWKITYYNTVEYFWCDGSKHIAYDTSKPGEWSIRWFE